MRVAASLLLCLMSTGRGVITRQDLEDSHHISGQTSCMASELAGEMFLKCTSQMLIDILEDCSFTLDSSLEGCRSASGFLTKTVGKPVRLFYV
jgi:hypothetical protein